MRSTQNALLAPYRVRLSTQELLFNVAEAYKAQLWCPHQAGLEFQENRLGVIEAQQDEYENLRKKTTSAAETILQRRREHPVIDADRFEDVVRRAAAGIARFVDEVETRHPEVLGEDRDQDLIRDRWDELLKDRVGPPLAVDDKWVADADKRYATKIPPGFEDRKRKKEGREYGDLKLWFELLEHVGTASERPASVPVMFVTDDVKEDWWRIFLGQRLGPQPALTDEIARNGGSPFWIFTVSSFIELGAKRLGWEVAPDAPAELRSIAEQLEQPELAPTSGEPRVIGDSSASRDVPPGGSVAPGN